MKKGLSVLLALVLVLGLAVPAFAENQDTDPPAWRWYGYSSLEEMLDAWGYTEEEYYHGPAAAMVEGAQQADEYLAAHPAEYAAFDPYGWFEQGLAHSGYFSSYEEYMEHYGLTPEQFELFMAHQWAHRNLDYDEVAQALAVIAETNPEAYAAFDPYLWFAKEYDSYESPGQYMEARCLTEEEFTLEMARDWMYALEEKEALAQFIIGHPEEYAQFDPYAWYHQYYFHYGTAEAYMGSWDLTAEEFELEMALDWMRTLQWYDELRLIIAAFSEAYPEEYAAFDPYLWFAKEYDYYESPEEYMQAYGYTEEVFELEITWVWINSLEQDMYFRAELAQFIAGHPEEYALFSPYAWYDQQYSVYYGTAEEYMEAYSMAPEEFEFEMALDWMWNISYLRQQEELIRANKEALGAYADGINLMANGQCITYSGVRAEIADGRVMAPLAETMAYLGAEVFYSDSGQGLHISLPGGALSLYHLVGTNQLTVTGVPAGEASPESLTNSSIQMDAASYTKDGEVMVPISYFAQLLGYRVSWDNSYQTVVLLDPNQVAQRVDEELSILSMIWDELMNYTIPQTRSLLTNEECSGTAALVRSSGETQEYTFSIRATMLENRAALNLELELDVKGLAELYLDWIGDSFGDGFSQGEKEELLATLEEMGVEMIAGYEEDSFYLRGGIIDYLLGGELDGYDWLGISREDALALSGLSFGGQSTLGEALTETYTSYLTFTSWQDAMDAISSFASMAGDNCFIRSGNNYELTIGPNALMRMELTSYGYAVGEMTDEEIRQEYDWYTGDPMDFSLTLMLMPGASGNTVSCQILLRESGAELSADLTGSGKDVSFRVSISTPGMALELTGRRSRWEADEEPRRMPDPGESIYSLPSY